MSDAELRRVVRELVSEVSGRAPEELSDEAELVADLGLDSPKALQLLVALEERLGVELADDELASVHTVADVVELVERLERGG